MVSKEKEPDMTVWTEDIITLECRGRQKTIRAAKRAIRLRSTTVWTVLRGCYVDYLTLSVLASTVGKASDTQSGHSLTPN